MEKGWLSGVNLFLIMLLFGFVFFGAKAHEILRKKVEKEVATLATEVATLATRDFVRDKIGGVCEHKLAYNGPDLHEDDLPENEFYFFSANNPTHNFKCKKCGMILIRPESCLTDIELNALKELGVIEEKR